MVKTQSGFLYAPIIEFYLDWLERLNSKATEAEFGSLASGRVLMIRQAHTGMVSDIGEISVCTPAVNPWSADLQRSGDYPCGSNYHTYARSQRGADRV